MYLGVGTQHLLKRINKEDTISVVHFLLLSSRSKFLHYFLTVGYDI